MQRGDVRVTNERLGIALEDLRLEVRNHAYRTVPTGPADDCLHSRIQPHAHEVLGAPFIFGPREATQRRDLRIEKNGVARALQRFDAARQPADAR